MSERAFPTNDSNYDANYSGPGMTLRDYFAAKAMQGMLAGNTFAYESIGNDAEIAYQIADAMLKERAK